MRPEKESIVKEYADKLEKTEYVLLADYRGLTVEQFAELRKVLRETGSSIQVVRNGLFALSLNEAGWDSMTAFLDGPTAMIYGEGDVTVVAKKIKEYRKDKELPVVRGGKIDGTILTKADVDEMALIPPREVLLGQLVGTVAAPMTQCVGVLNQKLSSLLYVLKAIEDKKNKQ